MNDNLRAYVIEYNTGEYSDRTERIVCVYLDKATAERHLQALNDWLKSKHCHFDDDLQGRSVAGLDVRNHLFCPLDPSLDYCDYTGGKYQMYDIPLLNSDALAMLEGSQDVAASHGILADWMSEHGWDEQSVARWRIGPRLDASERMA